MLKHFGCGPNNEAMLGDLAEQYQQRGSVLWYWRQAMKAIPLSLLEELRGHKRIAASALLTGWGMWAVYVFWILPLLTPFFLGGAFGVAIAPRDPIGTAWSILWAPVLIQAGGVRSFSIVFAVALPFVVWTTCGWLVARLHRGRETAVVLLCAGSILLLNLLFAGPFILRLGPRVFYGFLASLAANVAASLVGIVIGGGLLRDHSRPVIG
jgi:hypothetical protein